MAPALVVYRTVRPLPIFGRIVGTGERIKLPEVDGDKLVEQGYLLRVVNGETTEH